MTLSATDRSTLQALPKVILWRSGAAAKPKEHRHIERLQRAGLVSVKVRDSESAGSGGVVADVLLTPAGLAALRGR